MGVAEVLDNESSGECVPSKDEVVSRFTAAILGAGSAEAEELNDTDEMLYHRIAAKIEMEDKLVDHIPSRPTVLLELLAELEKEETDFTRIEKIVAEDVGLIGEILRISNSPLYLTRSGEVTSLEKAVALLGFNGVMKVASTVVVRNVVDVDNCHYSQQLKKLWTYCLQSGESCQLLGDSKHSFMNYLLGLIHEIGSVSIISLALEHLRDECNANANDMLVIRRLMMERSAWLSSLVAAEWGMPEDYLLVLNEFDRLRHGQMDEDEYTYCAPSTKILEVGSLAAQSYNLLRNNSLDQKASTLFLQSLGLDETQTKKLFTRLDLAQATVS
jgi:HD-like signal output (HDOD) protein